MKKYSELHHQENGDLASNVPDKIKKLERLKRDKDKVEMEDNMKALVMKINIGDWICFMANNELIISEVKYIEQELVHTFYVTNKGKVPLGNVKEVRGKNGQD